MSYETTPGPLERFPWALRAESFADESIFHSPRASWTPGAWQDEPDIVEWRAPGIPYPLLIVRGRTGCLCGYVGLPKGHPLHGMWQGDRTRFTWSESPEEINAAFQCGGVYVPTGEPPTCWWLGFHCGAMHELMPAVPLPAEPVGGRSYVSLDEVRTRVEELGLALSRFPGSHLLGSDRPS